MVAPNARPRVGFRSHARSCTLRVQVLARRLDGEGTAASLQSACDFTPPEGGAELSCEMPCGALSELGATDPVASAETVGAPRLSPQSVLPANSDTATAREPAEGSLAAPDDASLQPPTHPAAPVAASSPEPSARAPEPSHDPLPPSALPSPSEPVATVEPVESAPDVPPPRAGLPSTSGYPKPLSNMSLTPAVPESRGPGGCDPLCTAHGGVCNEALGRCDCPMGRGGPDCAASVTPACDAIPGLRQSCSSEPYNGDVWTGPLTCECAKQCDDAGLAQLLITCMQVRRRAPRAAPAPRNGGGGVHSHTRALDEFATVLIIRRNMVVFYQLGLARRI